MQSEHSDEVEVQEILVDGGQAPRRIDLYLMDRLERVTRNKIQQGIRGGSVLVNDKEVKSNYKIRPHDVITVMRPIGDDQIGEVVPQDIPLDIIFEDSHLLVVNKEAGMVVHPGVSNPDHTLVNALAYYLRDDEAPVLPGNPTDRPGLVHRIDKDTSGLLVIAKNDFTLSALANQFFHHKIHRRYLALVWGCPEPTSGTIDAAIGRNPSNRTMHQVTEDEDSGKRAVTHYHVIEDLYYVSLVECRLETGRTHQIRVHLSHMGHPIFNDEKYGGRQIRKGTIFSKYRQFVSNNFDLLVGQALHAAELGFIHPVTKEKMEFQSKLPDNFALLMDRWRNYIKSRK